MILQARVANKTKVSSCMHGVNNNYIKFAKLCHDGFTTKKS